MLTRKGLECDLCRAKPACFFSGMKDDRFKEFRESRVSNVYRKRQVVYYEGHKPHGVFLVCAGRVKVYKSDGKGHQLTVRIAGPGELLGHDSLLAGGLHAATAEALDEATLAHVDEARFRAFLDRNPDLGGRLLGMLSRSLQAAEDKARDMITKSSRERLAGELLTIRAQANGSAANGTMRMPYTRQDLGELAGLAQETVIRLLTEMEGRRIIATNGRQLTIVNQPALERMAAVAE